MNSDVAQTGGTVRDGDEIAADAHRPEVSRTDDDQLDRRFDEEVLTLAEERASVTKRRYESGVVRVRTVTESAEHIERAALEFESAEVTHHPVNQFVDAMPQVRQEGDLTILPVVEERLVVEKRLFVSEEIHIRRVRRTEEVELPVSLRRQHAVVERLDPDGASRDQPLEAAAQFDRNK